MEFLIFSVVSWLVLLVPGFNDSIPPTEDKIFKIEIENEDSKTIESIESSFPDYSGLVITLKDHTMKNLIIKIPKNMPLPSTTYEDLALIDTNLSYNNEPFILADREEIHYDTIDDDPCFYKYEILLEDQTEIELIYTVPAVGNFFLRGENLDEDNICYNQVFYEPPFEPPLKQLKNKIYPESIMCNEQLQLVKRINDKPSCIKPESILKLIERGWTNKTIVSDIQEEDHVVLITVSKNGVLSKGTGFDLPEDTFTLEDLKELEQKEKELRKIQNDPNRSYKEKEKAGREIHNMQDRLQNPFQTGVPYHLVKILQEKYFIFEEHFFNVRGEVWWTGSSPNDISHTNQALRIGIASDHFTLSELEYQDKKIREYLGNEMNILYKKSGYPITLDR